MLYDALIEQREDSSHFTVENLLDTLRLQRFYEKFFSNLDL